MPSVKEVSDLEVLGTLNGTVDPTIVCNMFVSELFVDVKPQTGELRLTLGFYWNVNSGAIGQQVHRFDLRSH